MINPIPTVWGLMRRDTLPVIDVIGRGNHISLEKTMIGIAADILRKASLFQGVPYVKEQMSIPQATIIVFFSIKFPSDAQLMQFLEYMKNNKK